MPGHRFYLNASRVADAIGISSFCTRRQLIDECLCSYWNKKKRPPGLDQFAIQNVRARLDVVTALAPKREDLQKEIRVLERQERIATEVIEGAQTAVQQTPPKLARHIEAQRMHYKARSAEVIHRAVQDAARPAIEEEADCPRAEIDAKEAQVRSKLNSAASALSDREKRSILQGIASEVNAGRGVAYEADVLDQAEREFPGRSIARRNAEMYYLNIPVPPSEIRQGGSVRIGGRIDGMDDTALVEAKVRRYKLMGIRDYEKVQLELYLRMTGLRSAILVESCEGKQAEHRYVADPQLWSLIQEGLCRFHREVGTVLDSSPPEPSSDLCK